MTVVYPLLFRPDNGALITHLRQSRSQAASPDASPQPAQAASGEPTQSGEGAVERTPPSPFLESCKAWSDAWQAAHPANPKTPGAPSPEVRMGATQVSGRLPPEVIQRVVGALSPCFQMCYAQGLARSPKLNGRVVARFIIERDGSVSNAAVGESDLRDDKTVSYVISSFNWLKFPQPEDGIVTVVYPILLGRMSSGKRRRSSVPTVWLLFILAALMAGESVACLRTAPVAREHAGASPSPLVEACETWNDAWQSVHPSHTQASHAQTRMGATQVSGRLPPEVIQRVVREHYSCFRMCYLQGLARDPYLEGRVVVRFIIGRDGTVSNASNGGSDLPDTKTVSCVISMYYWLRFPQPEGGIVTVVYPILFSPG